MSLLVDSFLTLCAGPPLALSAAEAELAGRENRRGSREGVGRGVGETNHLLLREFSGILDLLGHGEAVTACTRANGIHACLAGEVVTRGGDKVHGRPHLKVSVQKEEVVNQVGILEGGESESQETLRTLTALSQCMQRCTRWGDQRRAQRGTLTGANRRHTCACTLPYPRSEPHVEDLLRSMQSACIHIHKTQTAVHTQVCTPRNGS